MIHARSHVPIDGPHFITWLIFTNFLEIHSLTLENTVILARERFANEPIRAQFDLPDFFQNFAGNHSSGTLVR